jgi:hypothetical protein
MQWVKARIHYLANVDILSPCDNQYCQFWGKYIRVLLIAGLLIAGLEWNGQKLLPGTLVLTSSNFRVLARTQ